MPKSRKRRKSASNNQENKHFLAGQKQQFKIRLFNFAKKLNVDQALELIPEAEFNSLFGKHLKQFSIKTGDNTMIPPPVLAKMEALVNGIVRKLPLLHKDYRQFTILEYLDCGHVLWQYYKGIQPHWYSKANQVKEALHPIQKMIEENGEPTVFLIALADSISTQFCKANSRYYWMNIKPSPSTYRNNGIAINLILQREFCQKKIFKLENKSRPAFRIGIPSTADNGMKWLTGKLEGKDDETGEVIEPFDADIYLQSHALIRLYERLDGLDRALIHSNLLYSLQQFSGRIYKDQNLIEYYFQDTKMGYLVLDFTDQTILIRTFLFLTHNKTPEGDKLAKLAKLSYSDIPYWQMDKLSTFTKSDIGTHPQLRELFEKAGYGPLFEFDSKAWGQTGDPVKKATALSQYLVLNNN